MISGNILLHEQCKIVTGLAPILPNSSTPDFVSMKGYNRCCIVILCDNNTTVTGCAVTVKQATDVANSGSDEKAVAFSEAWRNIDTGATDPLTSFAVTSDTFTTDTTNSKNLIYVIEINETDLDHANGFGVLRAGTANTTAQDVSVLYLLYPAKFGAALPLPSAILD